MTLMQIISNYKINLMIRFVNFPQKMKNLQNQPPNK